MTSSNPAARQFPSLRPGTTRGLRRALCGGALLLGLGSAADAATIATWDGGNGSWTDGTHWSTKPVFPNNGGGNFYDAVINAGAVALNQNITINLFQLGGGSLEGTPSLQTFTLTALEGMQWTGGAIRGSGGLSLGNAGPTTITGGATALVLSDRTINNSGSATFTAGTIRGGSGAILNNLAGATFTVLGGANFFADIANPIYTINNAGTFTARSAAGSGFSTVDAVFNNNGTLRLENTGASHTLSLAGGGTHSGPIVLAAGTSLELGGNTALQAGANATGAGVVTVAGNVNVSGMISASNLHIAVGELNLNNNLTAGTARQTGGTVKLNGFNFQVGNGSGIFVFDDGTLTGIGTLAGSLQAQGNIAPGNALGTLVVTGSAAFGTDAHLVIEIGGAAANSFDRLNASSATLGGQLDVRVVNGFAPDSNASFTILNANSVSGVFANAPLDGGRFPTSDGVGSFSVDYTPNSVVLSGYIPEPAAGTLMLLVVGLIASKRRRA